MTNAYYNDISQYRDVESLNYYNILLSEGKIKEQALEILAARSRDNSRTPMQWAADKNAGFTEGTIDFLEKEDEITLRPFETIVLDSRLIMQKKKKRECAEHRPRFFFAPFVYIQASFFL